MQSNGNGDSNLIEDLYTTMQLNADLDAEIDQPPELKVTATFK